MSLINDALKRAEAEKRGNLMTETDQSSLSPVQDPAGSRLLNARIWILGVAFVAVCVGGWFFVNSTASSLTPKQAAATPASKPTGKPIAVAAGPSADSSRATLETNAASPTQQGAAELNELCVIASQDAAADDSETQPAAIGSENVFRLDGIMCGPLGTTAIINGKLAQVGSIIDGAKVLTITQHAVVLELNGETFTINL